MNFGFGLLFGLGLMVSGMCRVSKIIHFLTINSDWDPSLSFVMMSAVLLNLFTFHRILKRDTPLLNDSFTVPPPTANPDLRLIVGSIIFGFGWGMCGLCPGPGLVNFFVLMQGIFFIISVIIGQRIFGVVLDLIEKKQKAV